MAVAMDDIAPLVVTPFQEIVDKGKTALDNAGESEVMAKAAQSLVKEGERALKRIEPLCKKYADEFGVNFRNALRDNGEISDYRTQLTDLLWEFEDFIDDPGCFDADKFTELQALSRKAAPKIYDILMRMKLETPYDNLSPIGSIPRSFGNRQSPSSQYSSAFSPTFDQNQHSVRSISSEPRPDSFVLTIEEATKHLERAMDLEDGFYEEPEPEPPRSRGEPPPMPNVNPWAVNEIPPASDAASTGDSNVVRRSEVTGRDSVESPVDAPASPSVPPPAAVYQATVPVHHETSGPQLNGSGAFAKETNERFYRPISDGSVNSTGREKRYDSYGSSSSRQLTTPIPEESALDDTGGLPMSRSHPTSVTLHDPPYPSPPPPVRYPVGPNFGTCVPREAQQHTPEAGTSSHLSPKSRPVAPDAEGLQVAPSFKNIDQEGPIPVDLPDLSTSGSSQPSPLSCNITPQSSFWMAKGFCEGAKEVSKGRIGVKKTKKPVGFTTSATVARCTSCMCELDFKEIENDVNKLDSGTYSRGSISYRVRFLQKSHIAAKRVDDVQYGCLFCLQQGHTLDESDATVFFSPRALMDHIARHPRPLPDVSGLVIVDGPEVPPNLVNDFDIQLRQGPVPHPVTEIRSEILHLPTGIAKEPARRLYGQRLLFDRSPALELAQGARITGIEWPARYNGEWAFGWHDAVRASVPTDILKLDTPPDQHIKIGGGIRARARWRFNPGKEKGSPWLKFEKNDVITNIAWAYFDHWCWSGTNPKGKWGIFPQAFIDTNTLEEPKGTNRAMSLTDEMNRSTSFMASFGRRRSGSQSNQQIMRPSSVAGSTSSHDSKGLLPVGRGSHGNIHGS